VENVPELVAVLKSEAVDVVLVAATFRNASDVFAAVNTVSPGTPTVLLGRVRGTRSEATAQLPYDVKPVELVHTTTLLSRRPRGPRPVSPASHGSAAEA
jgi:hypothetical protein